MYTLFRLQKAIGIVPLDKQGSRLDASLITWQQICCLHAEAMTLCIAAIHTKQHAGPVLGLSTASTSVKGKDGIVGIVLAGEQYLQLQLLQSLVDGFHISHHISLQALVLVLHAQLPHYLYIIVLGNQGLVFIYADLDIVQLLINLLSLLRIVPEGWFTHLIFQFGNFFFLVDNVQSLFHLCQASLESRNFRLQILQHQKSHPIPVNLSQKT